MYVLETVHSIFFAWRAHSNSAVMILVELWFNPVFSSDQRTTRTPPFLWKAILQNYFLWTSVLRAGLWVCLWSVALGRVVGQAGRQVGSGE